MSGASTLDVVPNASLADLSVGVWSIASPCQRRSDLGGGCKMQTRSPRKQALRHRTKDRCRVQFKCPCCCEFHRGRNARLPMLRRRCGPHGERCRFPMASGSQKMASRIVGTGDLASYDFRQDIQYLNSVEKQPEEYDEFAQGYWKNLSLLNSSGCMDDSQYKNCAAAARYRAYGALPGDSRGCWRRPSTSKL